MIKSSKKLNKIIIHMYKEDLDWQSSYSMCGTQLHGIGMQGRELQGTDNIKEVSCKKCIKKIKLLN